MNKNTAILSITGLLLIAYIMLFANEFEIRTRTDFWILPTETAIFISMVILLLLLETTWWTKLIVIFGIGVLVIFGLPQSGIWRSSVRK